MIIGYFVLIMYYIILSVSTAFWQLVVAQLLQATAVAILSNAPLAIDEFNGPRGEFYKSLQIALPDVQEQLMSCVLKAQMEILVNKEIHLSFM